MTIESNISKNIYTGNGQTTIFPFTYKIWKENEIEITLEDEKGITSTVTPFAVTINKNGGGEVVLYIDNEEKTPIPQGYKIALTRSMPFLQKQDYLNGGRFNAEVIEDNFDMACAERQELKEKVERAVIIPPTSDQTPEEVLQDFLLKYYDIIAKYPEIIHAFATIYPRIEEILTECIANKDLAHAWAESENPPDPNNLESKSAKTWALIASDILPIATDILLGKVKGGGNIIISQDGTMNVEQSILDSIAGNAQAIAINAQAITNLQADKLDKSAISSVLDSESEETAASSQAVKLLNDKMGKVRLLATRTSGGAVTLTDVVIGKPIFIISCFKAAASGSMCHARYSVIFGSEHNDIDENGTTHIFGGPTNYVSPSTNGTGYVYGNQCAVVIPAETTVEVAIEKVVGSLEIKFFQ